MGAPYLAPLRDVGVTPSQSVELGGKQLTSTISIRDNYDRIVDEYATHLFGELHNKPLDQELLHRFASQVIG
jgi:hypothetical protein